MFIRKSAKIIGENAISDLHAVTIGGIKQWIYIRGENKEKPILLMLHGGPGTGQIGFIRKFQTELEEKFVVVQWDQRGAGLSYSKKVPLETMKIDQFVQDTIEVTNYILNRLNRKQVYLVGHSWGTILGMLTIQRAPNLYKRYFGVSQVTDVMSSEKMSYTKLLEKAQIENNRKAYEALSKIGPPPWTNSRHDRIHQKYIESFGGGITHDGTMMRKIFLNLLTSKEYTWLDFIRFMQGQFFSMKSLQKEMRQMNLMERVESVNVPIYFIMGKHDLTNPSEPTKAFFNEIEAPEKQWIIFENSAHSPIWEEPEKLLNLLLLEAEKD